MKPLIILLIAILLWAGNSRGQSVIIGTGTTTTNGFIEDPVDRYNNYEHYQIIYTAAELTAAGMPSGAVITALGFSISESAESLANYTIKMGLTTQTIAQPYISALTTVKTLTYTPVVETAGNFDMIAFTTNFTWDGASNIVVNTCTGSNPFNEPYGGLRYTAAASGTITYDQAGFSDNCATTSLASTIYRPNIKFNYTISPCSGTPAPGNTISTANPACSGVSFTLSLQNSTPGTGVTYQWQSSATGANPWTDVGTSSPIYTTSQTTAKYFRCQVTCSGNTGISAALQVTVIPFYNCNCSSMASSDIDEEIYSVTVGGNTNAYDCTTLAPGAGSILNMYSNFYPLGSLCNLPRSTTVPFTILEDECDGDPYYDNGCAIWVDFNQDADFTDAGEQVYSETTLTSSPRTVTGSILVPAGAILGETAMRITVAENYNGTDLTPCLVYLYGETEDYLVNVIDGTSPALLAVPGSINFGYVLSGSTSSELSYTLSGINLTPPSGNITITPPANFQVSLSTGGPYSSSPITKAYTGGALAATTVYAVFKPTAANTVYSGNISNAGGGAATVYVAVSGSSYCDAFSLPLCESFPSDVWPSCWTEQLQGLISSSHWSIAGSNTAGGTAYEAQADYSPAQGATQTDNDRMVSPPFNTTGLTSVHLSFHQMLDDDIGINDVWIKVQSSSNGRTWTDEWVYAGGLGNSITAEVKELDITNNLGGTTWLAWTLSGNTYDINDWYIDDVCIALPCATNTWTGAVSTDWNDPENWTCGISPDQDIIVIIPSNPSGGKFPVISSGIIAECYEITVELPGTLTIQSGGFLDVKNP